MLGQGFAGPAFVLPQQVAGLGVTEAVREVGGGFDVGENTGAPAYAPTTNRMVPGWSRKLT